MSIVIVAEKASAARNMATALGGTSGAYQGQSYQIVRLQGHLYEWSDPSAQVKNSDLVKRYKSWGLANLPWDLDDIAWRRVPNQNTSGVRDIIKTVVNACNSADEIVCATDLDPTGEGDVLFWEVMFEAGLEKTGKKFSRMEFTDEMPKSIQHAFTNRRPISDINAEEGLRKGLYRSKWDWLSMQFTRVATAYARAAGQDTVVRQGRLKSVMVKLVGDQQAAYESYVKKPFFQNRFRDENGVIYTNEDEPTFDTAGEVPNTYHPSAVVQDSVTEKRTAPRKLWDLAKLSAKLSAQGIKPAKTLDVYQAMYEAGVVSYPRTEDTTVTTEQFNELLPLTDAIADVVGVNAALLTHRVPRKSHVKDSGAHGANRPGPKVPTSMNDIKARFGDVGVAIYDTVARSWLASLAEDYIYDNYVGHVANYPDFVGSVNVAKSAGWRAVFAEDFEDDEASGSRGLGTTASPFVHEGANKRPQKPSMGWLMRQLEKRSVGTGATRTSTYADVTNARTDYPLLIDDDNGLRLAPPGEISWRLLPGTKIGDLDLTERIYAEMKEVGAGSLDVREGLLRVADYVRADIAQMEINAKELAANLGVTLSSTVGKEKATGLWRGQNVKFNRVWAKHRFSDAEVAALLNGDRIVFEATTKAGVKRKVAGRLGKGIFKGQEYVGFIQEPYSHGGHEFSTDEIAVLLNGGSVFRDDWVSAKTSSTYSGSASWDFENKRIEMSFDNDKPTSWCGHKFSDAEIATLLNGGHVTRNDWFSKKKNKHFPGSVKWDANAKRVVLDLDGGPSIVPDSWCGVTFSAQQKAQLEAGEVIFVKGFTSKKGKPFDANITFGSENSGRKRIIPMFD